MNNRVWRPFGLALLALVVLALWGRFADTLPCLFALAPVAVVAAVIAHGIFEFRKTRRRAWSGQYLLDTGRLWRIVQPGWLMHAVTGLLGVALSVSLLVQILSWSSAYWIVLALNVPLFLSFASGARRWLLYEVRGEWLEPLSRALAVRINVVVLTIVFLGLDFFASQSDYRGLKYDSVLATVAASESFSCTALNTAFRSVAYVTELSFWGLQNAFGNFEAGGLLAVFAWTVLFLASGAAAWGWSRFMMGLVYLAQGVADGGKRTGN